MKCLSVVNLSLVSAVLGTSTEANETICELPIDVVILQDTTGSFVESLPIVSAKIPSIVEAVKAAHPGSRFGAVEFKDKPYRDLGEPEDYCYRIASTITADTQTFHDGYSELYASGGGDVPEASLQALISTVLSTELGWRTMVSPSELVKSSLGDETEVSGARLIVMSTDATPHDPGDYQFYNGEYDGYYADEPYPPASMADFPSDPENYSEEDLCNVYDYPTMAQAAAVVKAAGVNVVFLVPEDETDAVEHWSTFNTDYLGQPDYFLRYIKHDSSDIGTLMINIADEIAKYVCSQSSTSTEEETTTVLTTLTTTIADTTTTVDAESTTSSPADNASSSPVVTSVPTSAVTNSESAPITPPAETTAPTGTPAVTETSSVSDTTAPQEDSTSTHETATTDYTTPFTRTEASSSSSSTNTVSSSEGTIRTRPETQPDVTEPEYTTTATSTTGNDTTAPTTTGNASADDEVPDECLCDGEACGCPEVVIKFQNRPKSMHLDIEN